jgi:hypothetical protein
MNLWMTMAREGAALTTDDRDVSIRTLPCFDRVRCFPCVRPVLESSSAGCAS